MKLVAEGVLQQWEKDKLEFVGDLEKSHRQREELNAQLSQSQVYSLTLTHSLSLSHTHRLADKHTHTHTHTQTHTHTHTHTHTQENCEQLKGECEMLEHQLCVLRGEIIETSETAKAQWDRERADMLDQLQKLRVEVDHISSQRSGLNPKP